MPLDLLSLLQVAGGALEVLGLVGYEERWRKRVSLALTELGKALAELDRPSSQEASAGLPPSLLKAAKRFRTVVNAPPRVGTPQQRALQALEVQVTHALSRGALAPERVSELSALIAEAVRLNALEQTAKDRAAGEA